MHAPEEGKLRIAFTEFIDLAAENVGGQALLASDEFFAGKENLLKPGRGVFIPGKFTENGKWMDGWESRRKRVPGHDWCILKLGLPGVVRGVDIDTNHFLGNFPEYASVDALEVEGSPTPEALAEATWTPILPQLKLQGGTRNLFPIASDKRWTHLRLNIFPDGGVARFRVHGEVRPDFERLSHAGGAVDLAAAENGGTVVACNDSFFGPKDNLILPGRAANMGEGWETRRKRVLPGFDWIVVKLAVPGTVQRVEVDTAFFKGNYPDTCSIEGCYLREPVVDFANAHDIAWTELLPRTKLQAHHRHFYESELAAKGPFTHVRLKIYPDGGVSRLRVHGRPA
ncbi:MULTISPECIES: allantoicase [Myxococcus]|uniref:allantoicase n=1 Tax=Myxococcus TaxID=32 RepID=UPI001129C358|nr:MULTISPECIES: allantoicase [Myxococcus]QDE85435.1 allantoicase [Myxococcus xanthus]QDE99592.1 allantoicase [Myxococcus xanthus]WAM24918.1 allantoicase [Myxococcus sp. NMCA1]